MKTQGEIEVLIGEGVTRFEQEYMGRGPIKIQTHLLGDMVVVRMFGVLTAAEKHLVTTQPPEKGLDLLKQVRTQLIKTARPLLEDLLLKSTGVRVNSLHHDISVDTDEEVLVFTLAECPQFRDFKKGRS